MFFPHSGVLYVFVNLIINPREFWLACAHSERPFTSKSLHKIFAYEQKAKKETAQSRQSPMVQAGSAGQETTHSQERHTLAPTCRRPRTLHVAGNERVWTQPKGTETVAHQLLEEEHLW